MNEHWRFSIAIPGECDAPVLFQYRAPPPKMILMIITGVTWNGSPSIPWSSEAIEQSTRAIEADAIHTKPKIMPMAAFSILCIE
jgi:hypothetical protein